MERAHRTHTEEFYEVTDSGKSSGIGFDKFALTLYNKNGGMYKSVPESLLQGGNIVVHIK